MYMHRFMSVSEMLALFGPGPLSLANTRTFGSAPRGYRIVNRLNRSRRWPPVTSYKHARQLSPFPDRPVR